MAAALAQSLAAGLRLGSHDDLQAESQDDSAPTSESGERRWDEGLSKEERSEAKRKYKNRRSAERWRRRKKEEKARAKAGGSELGDVEELPDEGDDAEPLPSVASARLEGECELVAAVQDTARNMLFEHSKLGKVAESNFMCQLQQLTAYSIIPGGFQQYKEEILLISERAVEVLQCDGPAPLKTARRYAASGLKFHPEWFSPTTANFGQVCSTYLQGREGHVKVPLTICAKPTARFSLKQLAMLPVPIQMEIYFRGVAQIRQLLPLAMQSDAAAAAKARAQIGHKLREVMTILSAYIMGNPSAFTITRTVRTPEQPPIAKLMSAAAAMGLSMETCRQLWGAWDAMVQQLPPLLAVQQAQEREIEEILAVMDHSSEAPYVLLLAKGACPLPPFPAGPRERRC